MLKVTQRCIREGIRDGFFTLYTSDIPRPRNITRVAVSTGVYGMTGGIFVDDETGITYAIPSRNSDLFSIF